MKKKNNWEEDLKKGEEIEYKLLEYLQKKYPKAYKMEGNFKDFDIEVPEKDIKIEVKRDIGSQESGNFFIEYECNYKPSGISTSKANYWVIYDEGSYTWVKISVLKSICLIYGNTWKGFPNGGLSTVGGYLIPKHTLKEHDARKQEE